MSPEKQARIDETARAIFVGALDAIPRIEGDVPAYARRVARGAYVCAALLEQARAAFDLSSNGEPVWLDAEPGK